uniref:Uncharacterized protein n=1 Tax=Glossina brevipalpis TaxID=37001 RepID=A0A1A9WX94_9MUSC
MELFIIKEDAIICEEILKDFPQSTLLLYQTTNVSLRWYEINCFDNFVSKKIVNNKRNYEQWHRLLITNSVLCERELTLAQAKLGRLVMRSQYYFCITRHRYCLCLIIVAIFNASSTITIYYPAVCYVASGASSYRCVITAQDSTVAKV